MEKYKGYLMVVVAASLWGVSGTAAQYVFDHSDVSMKWLVSVRMLISGLLFIAFSYYGKERKEIWSVWKSKKSAFQILFFGLAGMLAVQYTYFASIDEGNAAVATLLQYLAPVFIMIYFLVVFKKVPSRFEMISLVLALMGTFLLLTNGASENLTVPAACIIWGIISGVSLAFYTLYSGKLIRTYPSIIVVGWGMLIGGTTMMFIKAPWDFDPAGWTFTTIGLIIFVILFGTLVPFFLFIDSMRYITAKESSLLACAEPLSAVLSSVVWLGVPFGLYQGLGGGAIIIMVVLLTLKPKESKKKMSENVNY
ncbi:drug/metabolite transporter (DMT)-like permease [Peribacillus deserti]|uniref:Drug/metabolite transporter (DMT)-like permease n=1 Tax=Peribacillus deserti TaxID=673318 RepID=A0ABS2QJM7_9BACI|nr:EamA family transporter [Peribacillus deserti]MBM7693376.1 drug/metabolite transporter (DMT)-like permease [Peribacillus deserti]